MTIRQVDVFQLRHRLREPIGFAQWWHADRQAVLVKVTTDDGLVGWGECAGCAPVNSTILKDFLAPRLIGQDPLRRTVIWEDLFNRSRDFGPKGPFVAALSALDIALWDLQGRAFGVPVHTLLGGARVDRVTAYAAALYFTRGGPQPGKLAAEAAALVAEGFRALKMKVGLGLEADLANVRAVRRAIGPDVRLALDANHAYPARAAIELGLNAAVEGLWWLEEPVAPEDLDGYVAVRQALNPHGIAVAGGESETTRYGFLALLERRCVDLLQPDLCACGGFTGWQHAVTLAQTHGIEIRPHTWGTAVGLAATLHALAALPEIPGAMTPQERWLELDRGENPLREAMLDEFPVRDGASVAVPDGPGLGVTVDERRLEQWRV